MSTPKCDCIIAESFLSPDTGPIEFCAIHAAAAEMFEALSATLDFLPHWGVNGGGTPVLDDALAALARARGEQS